MNGKGKSNNRFKNPALIRKSGEIFLNSVAPGTGTAVKKGTTILQKSPSYLNNKLIQKNDGVHKNNDYLSKNDGDLSKNSDDTSLDSDNLHKYNNDLNKDEVDSGGLFSRFHSKPFSNNKNLKSKTEYEITAKIQKQITNYMLKSGLVLIIIFSFFILVSAIVVNISPLSYIKMLINKEDSNTVEKLGNFLTFRGWCSDEECQALEQDDFYKELNKIVDLYSSKYSVKLNKYLITSALTYSSPFANNSEDEIIENLEDLDNLNENSSNMIDFKKSKKKIKKLAKKMVKENTGAGKIYSLDIEGFREYLENEFVIEFYLNGVYTDETKLRAKTITREIFAKSLMFEDTNNKFYQKVYATCPGITVTNKDGSIMGTYPLEEYVAAVVRNELSDGGWNEAHKAQAIAARTYALYVTDNCTTTIENSTKNQTLRFSDEDDYAKKAAEETSGKILINDEKVFKSEYDSFCYDSDSSYYYDSKTKLHNVIYTKLPNGEPNKFSITDEYYQYASGGHGRGMSQVAAYMMSDEGKSYDEILRKFYSPSVKIVDMISFSGSFTTGKEPPKDLAELKERSEFYASIGVVELGPGTIDLSKLYSTKMGLLSQCPWYAVSRGIEIIYYSNMDDTRKYELINALMNSTGNGGDYYDNELKNYFERSRDYTMPMPGSIVSWTNPGDSGHVAIIESVDYENQTVVLTECMGQEGGRTWEATDYRIKTYSFHDIKYRFNSMVFNGYVYLLGKGE